MRVNSVSSSSFGSGNNSTREVLERFVNADDKELKYAARRSASMVLNEKKHRRMNNLLYWSIPLAGGLAAVASKPAKAVEVAGKTLSPLMSNLGKFAANSLAWAGTFVFIDLLFAGRNKLAQNSEKVRKFDREHPVLSTIATIGAGIGAVILGGKGLNKLAPVITKTAEPLLKSKFVTKAGKFITGVDGKLASNKFLNKSIEKMKAMPSALKSVLKGAAEFSPLMLLFANISHSFNFANAKRAETAKAYNELKTAQAEARELLKLEDELPKADIF